MDSEDFVDKCLCEFSVREKIIAQPTAAANWKIRMIEKHPSQVRKITEIYENNNENDIIFQGIRKQTRYTQQNYVRHPYKVDTIALEYKVTLKFCISRMEKLKEFNYELTIKEANSKEQRKLMTSELKKKIKLRDRYTCQICGKYMPDEVGLHIDHIIPVAKGGLSIERNLRVLCSKCNGKKGSKVD
jgi:hypothetical protein